jgi:hypothetical protein
VDLEINAIWHNHWILYTTELHKVCVHLSDLKDEIKRDFNKASGMYSTKLGYKAMQEM